MIVSLIVTTREGRIDEFRRFLSSLNETVSRFFEVIVVSQDCDHPVASLVQEYQDKFCIKHVRHTQCSISTARNIGLQHSDGRILGFPDDDCWYASDTLSGIIERFAAYPDEAFVCTAIVDPLRKLPFGHKRTANNNVGISVMNSFTFPASPGIFINRSRIKGAIAFDEQLGTGTKWGSGEETDLILSLLLARCRGAFLPAITVYHEINYDRPELFPVSKVFDYSRGFGAVIAKTVIERKQYAVSWVYMDLLARATIRLILAGVTFKKNSYLRHFSKTKGMLIGLVEGARYYAQ